MPATVVIAAGDQAVMNKSTNAARSHWTVNGSLQASTLKGCADCHDNHASKAPKLLGLYDAGTGNNRINGMNITADNYTFCTACHGAAGLGYPVAAPTLAAIDTQETYRDASGYFSPTPGGSVTADALARLRDVDRRLVAALQHGEDVRRQDRQRLQHVPRPARHRPTRYDELTATYNSGNFTLCLNCHKPAAQGGITTTDVAQFYSTTARRDERAAGRELGHRIKTAGGKLARRRPAAVLRLPRHARVEERQPAPPRRRALGQPRGHAHERRARPQVLPRLSRDERQQGRLRRHADGLEHEQPRRGPAATALHAAATS